MKIRLTALFLALSVFAAGCGSKEESSEDTVLEEEETETEEQEEAAVPANPEERLNIAISMPGENGYTKKLARELTNKLWVAGYNIILRYAEDDPELQAEQTEELFGQDISAFIFYPATGAELDIDSFNTEDIPVINIDVLDRNTECTDFYITYDDVKIGEDIGEYIINTEELNSKKNVTIEFLFGEDNAVTRDTYKGIMNKLSFYLKNGALVCRSGRTELESCTTTAKTAAEVLNDLGRYLSGYYLNNDLQICVTGTDYIASGSSAYFLSAGYTLDAFPLVTGVNGEPSAVRDFEQGFLSATSLKDASEEAEVCVEAVNGLLSGEGIKKLTDTKTNNGLKNIPTVTLLGQTVTKEDYGEKLVDSGYYTEEEIYG